MTSITSVQQYFAHLKDLQDLAAFGGKRYLMLPLDEPYFTVNANSREITVPAEFKKNGISVQGDEIAESLIFKINRFFDYADLDAMVVKIQWQNAKGEEGLSDAYVVDDVKDADYLYIMWPITSEITSKAGTIKFSLRFYKLNGGVLMYSFSTKVAAATINSGQDLNLQDTQIANAGGRFEEAIINSINTAAEAAMNPYFFQDLDTPGVENQIENADYVGETQLEAYIDETSPIQTLRVQATSNDAGNITYTWYYNDTLNTTYTGGLTYRLTGEDEYIPIPATETTAVPHKLYYKQEGGEYVPTSFALQEGLQLYEKTNVYKVRYHNTGYNTAASTEQEMPHVVGYYKAVAKNTVGDNYAETDSITIVFPGPEKIEFTETGNLPRNSYLNSTGEGSIQVEVSVDERGAKATYEWEFGESLTGPFYSINNTVAFTEEERQKWSVNEAGNVLTINGKRGFYKVKAITTRNYDTKSIYSDVTKVTLPLQSPVITAPLYDQAVSSLYGPATMEVVVTPFTSSLDSEGVTYQWFTDQGEAVEGATTATLTVPQGTRMGYYCVVTNHMGWDPETHEGGDIAETRSADFSVNPILPQTEPQPEPTDQGDNNNNESDNGEDQGATG